MFELKELLLKLLELQSLSLLLLSFLFLLILLLDNDLIYSSLPFFSLIPNPSNKLKFVFLKLHVMMLLFFLFFISKSSKTLIPFLYKSEYLIPCF